VIAKEAKDKEDVSFCPLAMPMVAGPGGLAIVLSVSTTTDLHLMDYVALSAAIAACCFTVWICFRYCPVSSCFVL